MCKELPSGRVVITGEEELGEAKSVKAAGRNVRMTLTQHWEDFK